MLSLVLRTLVYFRSLSLPVTLGVAIASAVIVGALVVGDSMRGSLRFIAMDRIGDIDTVLVAPRWFDDSLTKNLGLDDKTEMQSLILVHQAVIEHEAFRSSEMSLMGITSDFWGLGKIQPKMDIGDEEIVLNQTLAENLHVSVGDQVTLRVASQSVVPADNPLGKREQDTIVLPRWKVIEILPDSSLARFSLRSDQRPVMNAFANKKYLQRALEVPAKVNAVLIASSTPPSKVRLPASPWLEKLSPQSIDTGLRWERIQRIYPDPARKEQASENASEPASKTVFDYYHLTTDQMLITRKVVDAILEETKSFHPSQVLTYLANGTQKLVGAEAVGRNVPYSTISGVPWSVIARMLTDEGVRSETPSDANWTVVTQWLADEMDLKIGDRLRIEYFLPETVDGVEVEEHYDLTVVAIAPLVEPKEPKSTIYSTRPSHFNDPAWTPVVPGVTDQESMDKWDTPFKLERPREKKDDEYWDSHRLTPKLYVSHETASKLFGSRFGNTSSIRFDGLTDEQAQKVSSAITETTRKQLANLGWREIPLRLQQLRAASGTTPFDALFLSLSFFVIAAGLLLVALLFRLAIEQRAEHWGLLMASGWTRGSVRRLLLIEGAIISGVGSGLGVVFGLGYAYAMLAGLKSWWVGAITVSFLEYYVSPFSLVLGWLLGWLVALGTIYFATRQLLSVPISKLLRGQTEQTIQFSPTKKRSWGSIVCSVMAIVILIAGQFQQGQAQAGAFVGAGMMFLVSGLFWIFSSLRSVPTEIGQAMLSSMSLARSNAKRAPMRSILAIGLVSMASFLILSMSLFQATPNAAGTGGFVYVGKSSSAIHKDLSNPKYQREVLGGKMNGLKGLEFVPVRVRGGDDASCNNLYQANEPQVFGMSKRMGEVDRDGKGRSGFAWFSVGTTEADQTVWSLLEHKGDGAKESPVPVVLDQNTALWALHLGGYVGEQFSYEFDGRRVYFKTVGVLQNTILQGSLIVGEANFEKLFPSVTGHRVFFIKKTTGFGAGNSDAADLETARGIIENGWSENGLSLVSSESILKQLLAVQNTYLGAFQVLGWLGLLLGTIGLGIAQLRSAMERRGELAAMRAIGFTKSRLVWLLSLENGWQLMRGIGIGIAASALATLPAMLHGQPFSGLERPSWMLAMVMAVGLLSSVAAAWGAMRWPLLSALRADK